MEISIQSRATFTHCLNLQYKEYYYQHRLKTGPGSGPWTWEKTDPLKTDPLEKPVTICLEWHMNRNVELIHFHMKSRGMQVLVLGLTFKKCTIKLNFENGEVDR